MKIFSLIFTFSVLTVLLLSCSKENDEPEIVGCNKVEYNGDTYTIDGCSNPGVASFDVDITAQGNTVSFHVTCSNGCLSTVSVR